MRFAHCTHLRSLVLLASVFVANGAHATLIEFDTPVTVLTAGTYFNIATGTYGSDPDAPELAGVDFELYKSTGTVPGLLFAANALQSANAWVGSNQIGPFSLDPGTTVGPSNGYTTRNGVASAFRQDRTAYLGIRFFNEATSATNYGWMEITTIPGTNSATFVARVNRWGYDDSGAAIVTPPLRATPEPATFAALGLGTLALMRRRRRA